jgi:chromosomal replication initiator protein
LSKESQAIFDFDEQPDQRPLPDYHTAERSPAVAGELNSLYTFGNFVAGPSNEMAYNACCHIAKNPGQHYNPLLLHGSSGLGKTHLLHGIGHEILEHREYTLACQSCEQFVHEFHNAVEAGEIGKFRYKYRHADVLLLDDIQTIVSSDKGQEEFLHGFNALYNSRRQIVLASDTLPSAIPHLREQLISRLKCGLVAIILLPSLETRAAIVKQKCESRGKALQDEVCQFIAERFVTSVRELEGAAAHLLALSEVQGQAKIGLDFARRVLTKMKHAPPRKIELNDILQAVAERFDLSRSELQTPQKRKTIVVPRQIAMYLAKKLTRQHLDTIGAFFGDKNHTTVLYGIQKVKQSRAKDPDFQQCLEDLEDKIKK